MSATARAGRPVVLAQPRTDDPIRGILLILAAMSLFSLSDATAKHLSQTLPVTEVAWLRYATFAAIVTASLGRHGLRAVRTRQPGRQVLRGLALVGSAILFIMGSRVLPLAEASAIGFVSPMFITALSIPFLGERVGTRRWAAILVGLMGVLIVTRPGVGRFDIAVLFPILSALSWAFAIVFTRRMAGADRTETTMFWSGWTGFLLLSLGLPFDAVLPSLWEVVLGLFVGVVATTGQRLVVVAYRHASASTLAPFAYCQLITSSVLGFLFFGNVPDSWTLAGATVIIASGLYTAHRERLRAPA